MWTYGQFYLTTVDLYIKETIQTNPLIRHPKKGRLITKGTLKRGRCELCDLQNATKLAFNGKILSRTGIFKYMRRHSDTFLKLFCKKSMAQILHLNLIHMMKSYVLTEHLITREF